MLHAGNSTATYVLEEMSILGHGRPRGAARFPRAGSPTATSRALVPRAAGCGASPTESVSLSQSTSRWNSQVVGIIDSRPATCRRMNSASMNVTLLSHIIPRPLAAAATRGSEGLSGEGPVEAAARRRRFAGDFHPHRRSRIDTGDAPVEVEAVERLAEERLRATRRVLCQAGEERPVVTRMEVTGRLAGVVEEGPVCHINGWRRCRGGCAKEAGRGRRGPRRWSRRTQADRRRRERW